MVLLSSLVICIYTAYAVLLIKHTRSVLIQLSEVIAGLIDGREDERFSFVEDNLFSKLLAQVAKLSSILTAQNIRLKNERDDIKSLITDISHQLKTPLANLRIYFDLLHDDSLTIAQRQEFMHNMQGQLENLGFLMDSMIKMSRLESGIIEINLQKASLNDTCLIAVRKVFQKAHKKNITIGFEAKREIILQHDQNWTAEAIFNMLENGVKYTSQGGRIDINIDKYEMFARIDIRDTGTGLKMAEINQIFKRFYRGENARREEGAGIGLYLSREIIEKQSGYIKVQSKKGEGSTFSVFLPL